MKHMVYIALCSNKTDSCSRPSNTPMRVARLPAADVNEAMLIYHEMQLGKPQQELMQLEGLLHESCLDK